MSSIKYYDEFHVKRRKYIKNYLKNLSPEKKEHRELMYKIWEEKNKEKLKKQKHDWHIRNIDTVRKKHKIYSKKQKKYLKEHPKLLNQLLIKQRSQNKKQNIKRKQLVLKELGQNKCQICGFNKYLCSLDIHHLNGSNDLRKNFHTRFSKMSMPFIKEYCRKNKDKLMVLCSNCHKAYHSGLIELPKKST